MTQSSTILATRGLSKDYPGARALDGVDFDLKRGEVHVLFGENGAGKSTLISMLSGADRPTGGHVEMNGERMDLASVRDARARGISAVFQEFSLIPQMTVRENIFLGDEIRSGPFVNNSRMRRESRRLLEELDFDLPADRPAHLLTRAGQQMVEIAKAFRSELSVLILDEPTASLTDRETDRLFALMDRLTQRGVGIVYTTHRMAEIRRVGDRVTVLRDGGRVDTLPVSETDDDALVRLMTGREVGAIFPEPTPNEPGGEILSLKNVSTVDGSVAEVSMNARRGEIVGLAGLVGSGKSEAMRAAFGILPLAGGEIRYKGGPTTARWSPGRAIRAGFLYLPPDRKAEGLMMERPARENMALAALNAAPFSKGAFLTRAKERQRVAELADWINLSPNSPERDIGLFSGGNQQKAMLARGLSRPFDLVVFDEPTVGVDVGTRAAIYRFIVDLAARGAAVVIVSSDLPEILRLTDRAYVFHSGRVQAELPRSELSEEAVLSHFFRKEDAR